VATTVIEVGVDVPNASLMVIEHAERFGLASCISCAAASDAAPPRAPATCCSRSRSRTRPKARLKVIYESNDGFEIARQDLVIRGPGEFLGAKQSGVPLLRFGRSRKGCGA